MVVTMRNLIFFTAVCSGGVIFLAQYAHCAERVSLNTPALMAQLQAARTAQEMSDLHDSYSRVVTLTVAKVLELHVPGDYSVYPEAGVDLSRSLVFNRTRNWLDALPDALRSAGIDMVLDADKKTITLKLAKPLTPENSG